MSYSIQKHLTLVNKGASGRNTPQWLVVHFVGATGQAWDNAKYFRSVYREASAHYFVDKGNIVQVVEDNAPAWHVGDGSRSGQGKFNGYHGYGATNNNSLGIELCLDTSTASSVWHMDFHKETLKRAEWLIKQKQKQYNIPNERVIRHFDASGKLCPGNWQYNNWAKWWEFKDRLVSIKGSKPTGAVSKEDGKSTVNTKRHLVETGETLYGIARKHGTTVSELVRINDLEDATLIFPETYLFIEEPKKAEPKTDIEKLARETIAGKYGNGQARQKALGNNYNAVMFKVNELLGVGKTKQSTPVKSIDQLAREVIDGKHGTGDARKKSLGSKYGAVQSRVNVLLGGSNTNRTPQKSIDQLAREVIDGKHGTGDARRKSLGSRYSAVQSRVNVLLGGSNTNRTKTITRRVVDDVIAGKYGNGAERERRLKGAGYDPKAVQREVNKRF